MKTRQINVLGAVSLGISGAAFAGVTQVDAIARVGELAPGGEGATFSSFNPPFVNGLGQVGFTGQLSAGGPFVFHTDSVIWLNHHAPKGFTLTGTEATMGISDAGGFIYSPSTNGTDSVWTENGLLLRGSDPAPGMPGMYATFSSRPRMLPDGTAVWVAGMRDTPDSQTSQGRILYVCADTSDPSSSVPALHTQQQFNVGGNFHTPTASGIGFNFDASDNAQYLINELILAGLPTASNTFIWINGNLVHRQGDPVGDGTNWNSFRGVGINNSGDYCFGGATSGGPTATNEFLAYNGQIIARRGDTLAGIQLASSWATRWTSINNLGQVAHLWEGGSGLSL
ncbi:MAG TPA: hypothetical protein PK400_12520, partial [Phycisphaerales bacterium]|nr:hypothetical protein [Phycisphaerales bacterium]